MLSLEQCRKIDPTLAYLSDDELLRVRDHLCDIARLAIDSLIKDGVPNLPNGLLIENYKRAMLMEYDK